MFKTSFVEAAVIVVVSASDSGVVREAMEKDF